jgi:uncharacterized phiE125 gp8 family phage protein
MTRELQYDSDSAGVHYAVVQDEDGALWNVADTAFATYDAAEWTANAVTMTASVPGSTLHIGSMPTAITSAATYAAHVYLRAGTQAATSDSLVGELTMVHSGSAWADRSEPVSLGELRQWLRIDQYDDPDALAEAGVAARQWAETYMGRTLIQQSLTETYTDWPDSTGWELPGPPLVSVTAINYIDTDGATSTVTASIYDVDTDEEPGVVRLAYQQSWPIDLRGDVNGISITYQAGYGEPDDVPDAICRGICQEAYAIYEQDRGGDRDQASRAHEAAKRILAPYRVGEVA